MHICMVDARGMGEAMMSTLRHVSDKASQVFFILQVTKSLVMRLLQSNHDRTQSWPHVRCCMMQAEALSPKL